MLQYSLSWFLVKSDNIEFTTTVIYLWKNICTNQLKNNLTFFFLIV